MSNVGWHYPEASGENDELQVTNQVIGPADGSVQCLFRVFKRQFGSQHLPEERMNEWLVRGNNLDEFRANLWELVWPHLKRAVEVRRNADGQYVFRWGEPAVPTVDDVTKFVTFCEKRTKKVFTWNHITTVRKLQKWQQLGVILAIHEYSTSVTTRSVYQLLQSTLLNRKKTSNAPVPAPLTTPSSGSKPRSKPKQAVLPPAADGYSFRDEVRALRETFSQMRSLMVMLDQRIMLLEEKCEDAEKAANSVLVKMDTNAGEGEDEEGEEEQVEEMAEEDGDEAYDPLVELKVEMTDYEQEDD